MNWPRAPLPAEDNAGPGRSRAALSNPFDDDPSRTRSRGTVSRPLSRPALREGVMAAHPAAGRAALPARAAEWLLPAAVLAQAMGLLLLFPPPPPARAVIAAGAVGVALVCAVGWRIRARLSHLDALLVTGAFGGMAMLAAMWVERALAPGGHAAGAHHHHAVAWRASTVLMLAVCLPFCVWVCRRACHGHTRAGRLFSHAGVCVGMLGG